MRRVLQIASWLALAGIVIPPFMYFNGAMTQDMLKWVMLLATIVWFATSPFWMSRAEA